MNGRLGLLGVGLVLGGALLIGTGTVVDGGAGIAGMMGGNGAGMMGGYGTPAPPARTRARPASSPARSRPARGPRRRRPRLHVLARRPSRVAQGETVTFEVTSMGGLVHEFMVGPADAVAADAEGTPEVADIGMMQTKSVTFTFDGSGPYAFACHVAGHYEAGMRGTITVVG